ncbi:MAG: coproporphyrinogen dehydrogenase HemZ, partial [Pygmaiobacter sp.]
MQLYIDGLPSPYEIEQLTRMFYAEVTVKSGFPRDKGPMVLARFGRTRFLAAVRTEHGCTVRCAARNPADDKEPELALARLLFGLLCEKTGLCPPWGVLTGVRPVRLVHEALRRGHSDDEVRAEFRERFLTSPEKTELALKTAHAQQQIINALPQRSCSLYIGIPFCPSRCSYCSFVSRTIGSEQKLVAPYVDHLCLEIKEIAAHIKALGLHLCTLYIGGGTPTSLSAQQLRQLMGVVRECFDLASLEEYTVEAGRPDCTDFEKLQVLKEYGATRISINPQTLSDEVLAAIGRQHTAQDIYRCYEDARRAGHKNINMDLIAGLPKDTVQGFEESLRGVLALAPENITVHTLTLKRASNLVIDHAVREYEDVARMVEKNVLLTENGYLPY